VLQFVNAGGVPALREVTSANASSIMQQAQFVAATSPNSLAVHWLLFVMPILAI